MSERIEMEREKRRFKVVTVNVLVNFMQSRGILNKTEAMLCRKSGILPDDILERLKKAELREMN
jgi:hypothetical protein